MNRLGAREDLLPRLAMISDAGRREEAARRIYNLSGNLANVGAIARQRELLTGEEFRAFKPLVVVRQPPGFRRAFFLWTVATQFPKVIRNRFALLRNSIR